MACEVRIRQIVHHQVRLEIEQCPQPLCTTPLPANPCSTASGPVCDTTTGVEPSRPARERAVSNNDRGGPTRNPHPASSQAPVHSRGVSDGWRSMTARGHPSRRPGPIPVTASAAVRRQPAASKVPAARRNVGLPASGPQVLASTTSIGASAPSFRAD